MAVVTRQPSVFAVALSLTGLLLISGGLLSGVSGLFVAFQAVVAGGTAEIPRLHVAVGLSGLIGGTFVCIVGFLLSLA